MKDYVTLSMETHLFFARIMKEHSLFLEAGFPCCEKDLIEEAADKADKPSLGKRIANLFSSKYDKNGLLILKEEHFID